MSFFNKKSWLNKEKEDLKRFDEEIYGKDIELEVNIKDIFTLTLFLGSISGAINNNQLAGVQMEYVSNMQKIARLARTCTQVINKTDENSQLFEYLDKIVDLEQDFSQSIHNPITSYHIKVLKSLAFYYRVCFRLRIFIDSKTRESFDTMLEAIKQQVMYANHLALLE